MTILVGNYHGATLVAKVPNSTVLIECAYVLLEAAKEYIEKAALTEVERPKVEKLESIGDVIGTLLAKLQDNQQ